MTQSLRRNDKIAGFMQFCKGLVLLKKISRRDNGGVYLAGYSGDLLIDYGGILSLFEEEGRGLLSQMWPFRYQECGFMMHVTQILKRRERHTQLPR